MLWSVRSHCLRMLAALLLAGAAAVGGSDTTRAAIPAITLITHDPAGQLRPEDSCASKGCQALVSLIDGAQTSIDFAIYGARRQSDILNAVVRARQRGIPRGLREILCRAHLWHTKSHALYGCRFRIAQLSTGAGPGFNPRRKHCAAGWQHNGMRLLTRCEPGCLPSLVCCNRAGCSAGLRCPAIHRSTRTLVPRQFWLPAKQADARERDQLPNRA